MSINIQQVVDAIATAQSLLRAYVPVNPIYADDVQQTMNSAGDDLDRAALKVSQAQWMEQGNSPSGGTF